MEAILIALYILCGISVICVIFASLGFAKYIQNPGIQTVDSDTVEVEALRATESDLNVVNVQNTLNCPELTTVSASLLACDSKNSLHLSRFLLPDEIDGTNKLLTSSGENFIFTEPFASFVRLLTLNWKNSVDVVAISQMKYKYFSRNSCNHL